MTTKPKRKATAKPVDPIFAAIAEHKLLIKEFGRREDIYRTAGSKAEKKCGWKGWEAFASGNDKKSQEKALELAVADVSPLSDQWNRADRAARKAGMRMARTKPITLAGVAALVDYTQRNYTDEDNEDWAEVALKTIATALARMNKEAA